MILQRNATSNSMRAVEHWTAETLNGLNALLACRENVEHTLFGYQRGIDEVRLLLHLSN